MSPIDPAFSLVVLPIDAYDSIYQGVRALIQAEPKLAEKPFIPILTSPPPGATAVELYYRNEMQGLLHAFRLHGHIATHIDTLRFDQSNQHFARALMGSFTDIKKFVEASVSAFYEVFVFNSIARTGISCEFVPRATSKTPDIILPKMQIIIECKDIQGRELTSWSIPNLGRRIRECHEQAMSQLENYSTNGVFEHLVFLDLPDDKVSLNKAMSSRNLTELYGQVLDSGGKTGLNIERARNLVLSSSSVYHLVGHIRSRLPIVKPQIHPPIMFPKSPMKAMLFDAIFAGEGKPAWANWQPNSLAKLQFEHFLPTEYKQAKEEGNVKNYLQSNW